MNTPQLKFGFGFRSPYAWIARRLLRDLLPREDAARIAYLPCWTPRPATLARLAAGGGAFLYQEMHRTRQLYVMRDINRLCAHLGLALHWPVDRPGLDWEAPHLLYLRAEAAGCGLQAVDLLFEGRWVQGHDITNPALLSAYARALGLPAQDDREADAMQEAAAQALHRAFLAGVFGLPYFRIGMDGFWGVDRLPHALKRAGLPASAIGEAWVNGCVLDEEPVPARAESAPRRVNARLEPRLEHAL